MRFAGPTWSTCFVLVTCAANAVAQRTPIRSDTARRTDSATALAPVQVHASILPAAGPAVGSGAPARMSIVTGSALGEWHSRVLPDALGAQSGFSFYDDLGTPWKLNLSTRGFSVGPTVGLPSGVSVFVDGVRQNEPDAQEVNFDLLPIDHVSRVELLSGAASLLGPNSLGGAINLVTTRGDGPPSAEIESSVGSFGAYGGGGTLSGRTSRGWDYYLAGSAAREHGWREATGAKHQSAFVNLGRDGDDRGFRIQALAATTRAETAGSLPESIFDHAPRVNFTPGDYEDISAEQLSLFGYRPAGAGVASLTMYARHSAADRFNVNQSPDPNVRGITKNWTFGGTTDWRWTRALGRNAGTVAVRTALDAAVNRVGVRISDVPQAASTNAEELATDVASPSWDVAMFAIADYHLRRLTISAGLRDDYARVPFVNRLDSLGTTTSNYHRASPRGGVSVDAGHGVTVYTSVGASFRAPAILELGCADPSAACPLPFALGDDPPLQPVRATTYEAGVRWVARSLLASASLYRTDVRDDIMFVESNAALLSGYFTNVARTRRQGGDISVNGSVGDRVDWYANYAYTRATSETAVQLFSLRSDDDFRDSPLAGPNDVRAGNRLPLVPGHQLKSGATLRLGPLELGADVRYIGQQWLRGDEANETKPLDPYTLANARASFAAGPWEISTVVTNVFDTRAAIFGTFNENRQTGDLERFLTPMNARDVSIQLRRRIGSP